MDVGHCLLDGNADAVEFCPHNLFQHVLAASTYTLQEGEKPNRAGSISLVEVDAVVGRLELSYRTETAGIFDIKWNPKESNFGPLLAQGDADGYVRIHKLENCSGETESSGYNLKEVCGESISSSMCLCLDWSPSSTSIIAGLSDGSVSLLSFHESRVTTLQEWKAHDFEVWATSFDTNQPHLVYTGSDDCKFSCYDVRDDPSNSVFHNTKTHKMGVCCISKSPYDDNTVLTGSYDENLRVWDIRSVSKPLNEGSIHLGGGVWRIKHHPSIPGVVLTACMHNGFAIVQYDNNGEAEVIEKYDKHGSLAYGADWQRGKSYSEGVVATCSFYDKLLRVWTPKANISSSVPYILNPLITSAGFH